MRLIIRHTTRYSFDETVPYGLQQVRETPKSSGSQDVIRWSTTISGGQKELSYEDHHGNIVELISFEKDVSEVVIRSEGEVEVHDTNGVYGSEKSAAPLWLYEAPTDLTEVGQGCRGLIRAVEGENDLARLHSLSAAILKAVPYRSGVSTSTSTAEEAITSGEGVCQDHTHIFLACARAMGYPARYVSGYLMMDDGADQDATHAWAEAHVDGLGWVGFDVSNEISPDMRYVRVATGLDYSQAAPVTGTRFGSAEEVLAVEVEVTQQQQMQ